MTAPASTAPTKRVPPLGFTTPWVLAPMEGVTHRVFRNLIIGIGGVGAAWTEFLRVSQTPLPEKTIRRELGPQPDRCPVAVQLMGNQPDLLAATAVNAVRAGAPSVDINFGCPAPTVFRNCAGSALLRDPCGVGRLVEAVARAVDVPVSAKIRLGVDDPSRLRDIVEAVEGAGATRLTVHARTKADGYTHPARWEWLAKVVAWTSLPVTGNGDVLTPDDARRMRRETGVDSVMIGRGVLRDPWVFARLLADDRGTIAPNVGAAEVRAFHHAYKAAMAAAGGEEGVLGQLKQWWRRFDVAVPISPETRQEILRSPDLATLDARVEALLRASETSA